MTIEGEQAWLKTKSLNLFIDKEYHHHHSFEVINAYKDLFDNFRNALVREISIEPRIKKSKQKGIKAQGLNVVIRDLLIKMNHSNLKFEVSEENGVFYFSQENSTIGGFDFAVLNHYNNILALRNICFGSLHYSDGDIRWEAFIRKNQDLKEIADKMYSLGDKGSNIENFKSTDNTPLIVGEIQFGNWALAYRDFFKVLKADVQNNVDCLIYIVPTGELENLLSNSIVTFDKSKKIIQEFSKVITVPVWLVGLNVNTE